jgi:hypothetical protein
MSRDSSGNYTRPGGTIATFGQKPLPSSMWNAAFADLATEMTDSLSRSGKGGFLANISANGFKLTGIAAATALGDGLSYGRDATVAALVATTLAGGGSGITALNASNLASGTVPDARFPATLPAVSGVNLTALDASNLASGTIPNGRFPATLPAVSGVNLTALNASNLGSGTVPVARVSGSYTSITGVGALAAGSIAAGFGGAVFGGAAGGGYVVQVNVDGDAAGAGLRVTNASNGTSATAVLGLSTGQANTLVNFRLVNGASPIFTEDGGSAVTARNANYTAYNFRNQAGTQDYLALASTAHTMSVTPADASRTVLTVQNFSAGASAQARFTVQTGTPGASAGFAVLNNSGSEIAGIVTGAEIATFFYDAAQHQFRSQNSATTYALFQATQLSFYISNTEQWRVDSAGRLLNQGDGQPVSSASESAGRTTVGTFAGYTTEHVDLGGNLNATTGVFTAPVGGRRYLILAHLSGSVSSGTGSAQARIILNGGAIAGPTFMALSTSSSSAMLAKWLTLAASDTIAIELASLTGTGASVQCLGFSVYMMG